MNKDKIVELHTIFLALNEARNLKLSDFPYFETMTNFGLKLMEYLKEKFGDDIKFDKDEVIPYIEGYYKDVSIVINIWEGICLTIKDINKKELVNDFKEIFHAIVGMNPMCSYNECTNICAKEKKYYSVTEWNLHPKNRLDKILNTYLKCHEPIKEFEDYYTGSIISDLGCELFTCEGYKKLFDENDDVWLIGHKISQIYRLNPNLPKGSVLEWVRSTKKIFELSPEIALKKSYIDDGK